MTKRVLSVGQCAADHNAIRGFIESSFDAQVDAVADIAGALQLLCEDRFDLVLVNRTIDATSDDGTDLIEKMQDSQFLRETPVMLISNFQAAQNEAVSKGAVPGFGKAALDEDVTRQLLAKYL